MKLLSVTSFFLFAIFCLSFNNNISNGDDVQTDKFLFEAYKEKALNAKKIAEYDSAVFYARKMLQVSLKLKNNSSIKIAYDKLSFYFSKTEKYDSALYYSQKLYDLGDSTMDTLQMAKACFKMGLYNKAIVDLELAYKNFTSSKNLYLKLGDKINAGKKSLEIANIQKTQGNFGASELSALDGLDYLENTTESYSISGLYYILSVVSKETGNTDMALKRMNEAISFINDPSIKKEKRNNNLIKFNNTKANIYKKIENFDLAIDIYEDLLNNDKVKPNDSQIARIQGNLAHTLFLKEGFNKRSDSLLKRSLLYYRNNENLSSLIGVNIKLAELYTEVNKELAIQYADQALLNAEKLGNSTSIYESLEAKINLSPKEEDISRYIKLVNDLRIKREDLNSLYANERYDLNKAENKTIIAENGRIEAERKELLASKAEAKSNVRALILLLTSIYNNARDISKQIQNVDTGKGFPDELNNLLRSYQSDDVNVLLKRYETEIWKDISSHVKTTVYRVLQELLTNMKKHSNAALVVVSTRN